MMNTKGGKAAGHRQCCFTVATYLEDSGTQTELIWTTTTSNSTQTDVTEPITLAATSQTRTFIENGISTCLAPTIDFSDQTSPCVVHTPYSNFCHSNRTPWAHYCQKSKN